MEGLQRLVVPSALRKGPPLRAFFWVLATTLTVGEVTLQPTRVEFAMLRLLLVRYGHAVSRKTTAKFIGSAGNRRAGGRSIDAVASRIHCRLRAAGIEDVHIQSQRDTGYYLVIDSLSSKMGNELSALAA